MSSADSLCMTGNGHGAACTRECHADRLAVRRAEGPILPTTGLAASSEFGTLSRWVTYSAHAAGPGASAGQRAGQSAR